MIVEAGPGASPDAIRGGAGYCGGGGAHSGRGGSNGGTGRMEAKKREVKDQDLR